MAVRSLCAAAANETRQEKDSADALTLRRQKRFGSPWQDDGTGSATHSTDCCCADAATAVRISDGFTSHRQGARARRAAPDVIILRVSAADSVLSFTALELVPRLFQLLS